MEWIKSAPVIEYISTRSQRTFDGSGYNDVIIIILRAQIPVHACLAPRPMVPKGVAGQAKPTAVCDLQICKNKCVARKLLYMSLLACIYALPQ